MAKLIVKKLTGLTGFTVLWLLIAFLVPNDESTNTADDLISNTIRDEQSNYFPNGFSESNPIVAHPTNGLYDSFYGDHGSNFLTILPQMDYNYDQQLIMMGKENQSKELDLKSSENATTFRPSIKWTG